MHPILTPAVRSELLSRHKRERDRRVADRIKAVLWRDEGETYAEIARRLFLSEEGVRAQVEDYVKKEKIRPESGGSAPLLTETQTQALSAHITEKLYAKTVDICAYVSATFNVFYSVSGMTKMLKRLDFTYHQPCGVPAKSDAQAQAKFLESYEKTKANLGDNDRIYFMDGVHPTHAVRFVKGWICKGERREIPTNGSQKRINILGALELSTMQVRHQSFETLNAESTLAFLSELLEKQPEGTLHIVLDRGRYQYCKAVWGLRDRNPRLKLHYLPPYSPNLNTIECLWKIMHEQTTNNRFYPNVKQFSERVHWFFNEYFPKHARMFIDRLTDNFRIQA